MTQIETKNKKNQIRNLLHPKPKHKTTTNPIQKTEKKMDTQRERRKPIHRSRIKPALMTRCPHVLKGVWGTKEVPHYKP